MRITKRGKKIAGVYKEEPRRKESQKKPSIYKNPMEWGRQRR
jgi:hypothetical protein